MNYFRRLALDLEMKGIRKMTMVKYENIVRKVVRKIIRKMTFSLEIKI